MSPEAPPRCRMCALPAWRLQKSQTWSAYCGSSGHCTSRERICQRCEAPFIVNMNGADKKYCSLSCKFGGGYSVDNQAMSLPCAWCGKAPSTRIFRGGIWPYVCADCLYPIRHVVSRLKDHRVSIDRARMLIRDPGCEVCGANLLDKVRTNGRGKTISNLVVDHDHSCCPVDSHSCGKCVRGLLCYHCNWAAGQLQDSAEKARSLARYLDQWKNR